MPEPIAPSTPISVPEIAPASAGTKVSEINIPVPASIEKAAGIMGPKEALGEDSVAEMEAMEEKMTGHKGKLKDRPRDEKGRLIPTAKEKETIQPQPDKEAVAKEVKAKESVKPEPKKADAPVPVKAEIAKPEEAKAVEVEKPAEQLKAETKKEPTPEEKAKEIAAIAKRDEEWIEEEANSYGLTNAKLDKIIADGDGKELSRIIARAVLNGRKVLADRINTILDERDSKIKPILDRESSIQQFQTESQFLEGNPEIKSHPEGLKTYREVAAEYRSVYDKIQQEIAEGKATASRKLWAASFDELTPEQFAQSVAAQTKARLADKPAQQVPAKTEPEKAKVEAKKAEPKPFNADRPGAAARVATESADARQMREMNAHQGIQPI